MLLEFVTSPAGHLLNTGFQIKAENVHESGDSRALEVGINSSEAKREKLSRNGIMK